MRLYTECYPCLLRQALISAQRFGLDEQQQHAVIKKALVVLQTVQPGLTPPEIANDLHNLVRAKVGIVDVFREAKHKSTQQALKLYPRLKEMVEASEDKIDAAVRISIAGNIIDLAFSDQYADLWSTVDPVSCIPVSVIISKWQKLKLNMFASSVDVPQLVS